MKHLVVYKKKGLYTGWPLPALLPDGRLTVVVQVSRLVEHYALGERITLVSDDSGDTWSESDDPSIPSNWPGSSTRERHDRFEAVMPGGRYLAAGGVGWEVWPAADRAKAHAMGRAVFYGPDPATDDLIVGETGCTCSGRTTVDGRGIAGSGRCRGRFACCRFRGRPIWPMGPSWCRPTIWAGKRTRSSTPLARHPRACAETSTAPT